VALWACPWSDRCRLSGLGGSPPAHPPGNLLLFHLSSPLALQLCRGKEDFSFFPLPSPNSFPSLVSSFSFLALYSLSPFFMPKDDRPTPWTDDFSLPKFAAFARFFTSPFSPFFFANSVFYCAPALWETELPSLNYSFLSFLPIPSLLFFPAPLEVLVTFKDT